MPRIDFDQANKIATTNFDFPKLKLKNGERARIVLLESPIMEYVHTLQAPVIDDQGHAVTFEAERKDKTKYLDYKKNFLSRPLCMGDFAVLSAKGSDPKNCTMCAAAAAHPDWVDAPKPRYAMHVIRYKTKAGGFSLITPYSVEILVWAFAPKTFNLIADFKEEWKDLRKHDLLLGPCTNETFQQFEINVGATAEWLEDDARKRLTFETFTNNQIPDLSIAAGSRKEQRWIDADMAKIEAGWRVIEGAAPLGAVEQATVTNLEDDLSSLLDSVAAPAVAPVVAKAAAVIAAETGEDPAKVADDMSDLLGAIEDSQVKAAAKAPEVKAPAAPASDFDDLLAGI